MDQQWRSGNCYFFAVILKSAFPGDIVYDVVNGHFLFMAKDGMFYDWGGRVKDPGIVVKWDDFDEYDPSRKERIIRDCIR